MSRCAACELEDGKHLEDCPNANRRVRKFLGEDPETFEAFCEQIRYNPEEDCLLKVGQFGNAMLIPPKSQEFMGTGDFRMVPAHVACTIAAFYFMRRCAEDPEFLMDWWEQALAHIGERKLQ